MKDFVLLCPAPTFPSISVVVLWRRTLQLLPSSPCCYAQPIELECLAPVTARLVLSLISVAGLWDSKELATSSFPFSDFTSSQTSSPASFPYASWSGPGWLHEAAENTYDPLLHEEISQAISCKLKWFSDHFLQQCTCFCPRKSCWEMLYFLRDVRNAGTLRGSLDLERLELFVSLWWWEFQQIAAFFASSLNIQMWVSFYSLSGHEVLSPHLG